MAVADCCYRWHHRIPYAKRRCAQPQITLIPETGHRLLKAADGFPLAATLVRPSPASHTVLIGGALGVPRGYYAAFAGWLAAQGAAVLTLDYRGAGDSMRGPIAPRNIRMADWGRQDLQAGLEFLLEQFPESPLGYVGHSSGGQTIGLAPDAAQIHRTVLIATQLGDWRVWPHAWKVLMFGLWYAGIPLFSLGRDWFPTRAVGLGKSPIATGAMRDWARWGRSKEYLFNPKHQLHFPGLENWQAPVRMLTFSDDGFAPERAARALLDHYPASEKDFRMIEPEAVGLDEIGHFGFFRPKMAETLWPLAGEWLLT